MIYKFSGIVMEGAGYGRKIGFPTVNIITLGKELPKEGVYTGTATMEGKKYKAGVVVGPGEKLEAHLLGYSGDAYGKIAEIEICEFIRDFKRFDTEEELIAQINKDLEKC